MLQSITDPLLSDKDRDAQPLAELKSPFVFEEQA